ncbi:MAG: VanW family protein, partial [Clostridia bacterium]|nr:VanW family protein [Clostridia bacterium]
MKAREFRKIMVLTAILVTVVFCAFNRNYSSVKASEIDLLLGINSSNNTNLALEFTCGNKSYKYVDKPIAPTDFTVNINFHERKINAPVTEKIKFVDNNIRLGISTKNSLLYTFPLLETTIKQIINDLTVHPTDATISFCPNASPKFIIKKECDGITVNEEKLYYLVLCAMRGNGGKKIEIPLVKTTAKITAKDLTEQTYLRGEFSTDFSHSNANRKHNIKLALSKINGIKVDPGKTFSFNKIVGERSEKNGFMQAKIISGGEYIDGIGGGVCQASTTVYNCALISGLEIVKARAHSLPPSYVSPSFDAMVNSSTSDLVFRNDTNAPVYIHASGDNDRASVKIYGAVNPYKIVRESKTISVSPVPSDRIVVDENAEYDTQNLLDGEQKRVS